MKQAAQLAAGADPDDVQIAGILVHCRGEEAERLAISIDAMPGAEVFQWSPQGKLVVVAEAPAAKGVLDLIDAVRALPGVFNVSLVYQHAEPAASLGEPMPPDLEPGAPADKDVSRDVAPVPPGAVEQ
jgi:nitrate reductase NapD